jgi:hypothetical protein
MLASFPLAHRPLTSTERNPRPFRASASVGEFGWAAWSFSRQAKLNAWAWHGLGVNGIFAWAALGNCVYVRKDNDTAVHVMQEDVYLGEDDASSDSTSVEATTQWLDFGLAGKTKALNGMDLDVLGVTEVEVYVFIPNPDDPRDRTGTLAASYSLTDAESGWTYNGEVIPTEDVGSATEFMLKFIGDGNQKVEINRVTFYFDEVKG